MKKVKDSGALNALRTKLADAALTPQQQSKLKGGNGSGEPLPPVQHITEDYINM